MSRAGLGALAVVGVLVLAGCGGDDAPSSTSSPSARTSVAASASASASATGSSSASADASASASTYLPVPAGVTLTDQGSTLAVGQEATVAWQPRQDTVGVLGVTIDRLERTTLKRSFTGWKIPTETETSTPYFVRATLTNRGETDLSGKAVPLYVTDASGTLIEATTFASAFKPCKDGVFPAAFAPGASAQVCLVYFVPEGGELTAVSFRPTQEFNPITWTGEVAAVPKKAKVSATP